MRDLVNYLVDFIQGKQVYTCIYCGVQWKSLPSAMDQPGNNDRCCSMSCFMDHNRDFFNLPPRDDDDNL